MARKKREHETPFEPVDSACALHLLKEGNLRYMAIKSSGPLDFSQVKPRPSSNCRRPFAVVIDCSDTRLPPEILFDANIGQLFVVRTAGNIAGPTTIRSVEYAVQLLPVSLIVVMGQQKNGEDEKVRRTITQLYGNRIILQMAGNNDLTIAGANYNPVTGEISFKIAERRTPNDFKWRKDDANSALVVTMSPR